MKRSLFGATIRAPAMMALVFIVTAFASTANVNPSCTTTAIAVTDQNVIAITATLPSAVVTSTTSTLLGLDNELDVFVATSPPNFDNSSMVTTKSNPATSTSSISVTDNTATTYLMTARQHWNATLPPVLRV